MSDEVSTYIAAQPEPQRGTLTTMRTTIGAILPRAEECLAYGMPSAPDPSTAGGRSASGRRTTAARPR